MNNNNMGSATTVEPPRNARMAQARCVVISAHIGSATYLTLPIWTEMRDPLCPYGQCHESRTSLAHNTSTICPPTIQLIGDEVSHWQTGVIQKYAIFSVFYPRRDGCSVMPSLQSHRLLRPPSPPHLRIHTYIYVGQSLDLYQ